MELTPLMQRFVLHWGEMGARWGVNRTIAQIHALLYLAPRPINAEESTVREGSGTAARSTRGRGTGRGVAIACTGRPSRAGNVVRSVSCRRTTSESERARTCALRRPESLRALHML